MRPGEARHPCALCRLRFVLLPFGGIALTVLACGQGSPPEQVAAPAVTVVKVRDRDQALNDLHGQDRGEGKGRAARACRRISREATVRRGRNVKEGELLFVIEKGLYQAAVDQARANLLTSEAA